MVCFKEHSDHLSSTTEVQFSVKKPDSTLSIQDRENDPTAPTLSYFMPPAPV